MAINGINNGGFNPYATRIGGTAANEPARIPQTRTTAVPTEPTSGGVTDPTAARSIADAIKSDATARAAQINSSQAPDGVDQELWSVLTKDERAYFMKAGAMGPLTYGRFSSAQPTTPAPMLRGGRLDLKA